MLENGSLKYAESKNKFVLLNVDKVLFDVHTLIQHGSLLLNRFCI